MGLRGGVVLAQSLRRASLSGKPEKGSRSRRATAESGGGVHALSVTGPSAMAAMRAESLTRRSHARGWRGTAQHRPKFSR
jgi:hypothetical protein